MDKPIGLSFCVYRSVEFGKRRRKRMSAVMYTDKKRDGSRFGVVEKDITEEEYERRGEEIRDGVEKVAVLTVEFLGLRTQSLNMLEGIKKMRGEVIREVIDKISRLWIPLTVKVDVMGEDESDGRVMVYHPILFPNSKKLEALEVKEWSWVENSGKVVLHSIQCITDEECEGEPDILDYTVDTGYRDIVLSYRKLIKLFISEGKIDEKMSDLLKPISTYTEI